MLLSIGEIIFVVVRRMFETDLRRSFIGEIQGVSEVAIRAKGYPFTYDEMTNQFIRINFKRIHIFSLTDSGIFIRVIDDVVNYGEINYGWKDGQRIITDGKSFEMSVSEFGIRR
jgi:hypothetical protein